MPRKTPAVQGDALAPSAASMRPRPDAAENTVGAVKLDLLGSRASMRPRPDAAENQFKRVLDALKFCASMRPRPDAAENATYRDAYHLALRRLQ